MVLILVFIVLATFIPPIHLINPCPNIQCYIQNIKGIPYLDCDYKTNYLNNSSHHFLKCEYDSDRDALFISPIVNNGNLVERIAIGMFQRILSKVKSIKEVLISHFTINSLIRSDFVHLPKLGSLTLMFPKHMEEDSIIDIVDPYFFQLYLYCQYGMLNDSNFNKLRIESQNWRIILRSCKYKMSCKIRNCVKEVERKNEYYVSLTPTNTNTVESILMISDCLKETSLCEEKISSTNSIKTLKSTNSSNLRNLKNNEFIITSSNYKDNHLILNAGYGIRFILIILVTVFTNIILVTIVVIVGICKYKQKMNKKPCRGKHTIVLHDDL